MAFQIHKKFDNYHRDWVKTNLMVLIAIVFYPCYKLKFVRLSFKKLYSNDFAKADRFYDNLYNVLKRLRGSYASCVNVDKDDRNGSSSPIHVDRSKISLNNDTDMAFQIHKKFDNYHRDWAKTNLMVLIAIVFYPRYKLKFVRLSFKKLYPNDFAKADRFYDNLYNVLKRLHGPYTSCVNVDKDDHNGSSSPIHVDHSKISLNNDTVEELYSSWHEGGEDDVEVLEKTKLDIYLDNCCEKVDDTFTS
ncbi:hypothetical protein Cgig2_017898 [Carnegiea gigantea]|uniref:hAT-like transposase RNase-H fold domain-containing protein n=1 Tax=Carnegiea gigantea TaxID=171969 RepID=A0A9Q1JKC6_9CARY|nr:hypothetical protein Cgig2_017898 [Carnegiea gigantea]